MYSFYLVYLVVNHQIPRDLLFSKSYFKINIVNILFQTIYNQYIYIYTYPIVVLIKTKYHTVETVHKNK